MPNWYSHYSGQWFVIGFGAYSTTYFEPFLYTFSNDAISFNSMGLGTNRNSRTNSSGESFTFRAPYSTTYYAQVSSQFSRDSDASTILSRIKGNSCGGSRCFASSTYAAYRCDYPTNCEAVPADSTLAISGMRQCFGNAGCLTCSTSGACTKCGDGYMPSGNSCTASCPSGYYMEYQTCFPCPPGYKCLNATSVIKCDEGYYSLGKQASCTQCPEKFYCPSRSDSPIACNYGEYAPAGSTSCFTCPAGHYCVTVNSVISLTICPAGYYCPGGKKPQLLCPAGYYCQYAALSTPNACPDGYYQDLTTQALCKICDAGYYCPLPKTQRIQCPAGYYSVGMAMSCTMCPTDFECPAGSILPTKCVLGYYANPGSGACAACPAGYYCDDVYVSNYEPKACSRGYYSLAGSVQCTKCPAGSKCTDPSSAPVACLSGEYSPSGSVLCFICPAGSYCTQYGELAYARASICPKGTYANKQSPDCTICPEGYFCPDTTHPAISCPAISYNYGLGLTTLCPLTPKGYIKPSVVGQVPTQCAPGQYSLGNYGHCIDCPAGFQCPDPVSPPVECEYGYYAPGKTPMCYVCPAGYKCPDKTAKIACLSGYISAYGEVECHVCPPGWECRYGSYYGMFKCEHGYYSTSTTMGCAECPAGKYCLFPEMNPVDCPAGYYSIKNQPRCSICPAGFYCATKSALPTACAAGKWSEPAAIACTDCPPNFECIHGRKYRCPPSHYSTGTTDNCKPCTIGSVCSETTISATAIKDCNDGYYASPIDYTCKLCPPGYKCPSNTRTPVKCSIFEYQPNYGQTLCLTCPMGSYSIEASAYCMACPDGYKCVSGYPVKCPFGMYGEDVNCTTGIKGFTYPEGTKYMHPRETLCPKGYYCPVNVAGERTDIIPCPPGTYGIIAGAFDLATHCLACPRGYYCPPATDDYLVFECPASTYCPLGVQRPIQCPDGTYTEERGCWDTTQCRPNPAGFQTLPGASSPEVCPKGYYCPGDKKFKCPPGTHSGGRTGLTDIGECEPCPAGKYCPEGSASPQSKATLGYYNPWMGVHTEDYFMKCPPGYICDQPDMTTFKLKVCLQGYYCPEGTSTPIKCPVGTYSDSYTLSFEKECSLCKAGYMCAEGSTSATAFIDANKCPPGYYCPSGTYTGNKKRCPIGTYSNGGIKWIEECIPCEAGYYCIEGTSYTSMTASSCPKGYYCPEGTSSANQYPCPAGTTNKLNTGYKTIERCKDTPCGLGYKCPSAAIITDPTPCPAGTYNNFNYYSAECLACPAGYYCAGTTINPAPCDVGKYSDSSASACTDCEIGYYCPYQGISKVDMLSLYYCPAGHFCKIATTPYHGLSVAPDLDNHGCTRGKYCPKATTVEIDCPAGTYNPFKGRGNLTECITTPAGYYTAAGAYEYMANKCQEGYYCLAGSIVQNSLPCPKGTFRGIKGASVATDCATCPARYYCPSSGMMTPTDCPIGKYCPTGTIDPIFCPKGTYGPTTRLWDSKSCTLCDAGYFCAMKGMTALTVNERCDEGYYCKSGSMRPEPNDGGISGSPCPVGGYCPRGASTPSLCPAGKLILIPGTSVNTKCLDCPRGFYCQQTNQPVPTGKCLAGYYCGLGESVSSPATKFANPGEYAPEGSAYSYKCVRGMYSKSEKSAACDICPDGTLCDQPGMSTPVVCPAGFYCPSLSSYAAADYYKYGKIPCPKGTYGASTGLRESAQCTKCDAGKYCAYQGQTTNAGNCSKSYFCKEGAYYKYPENDPTGNNKFGICPAGYYCPEGTGEPIPCPKGTFSRGTMLYQLSQCTACPSGYYCSTLGLTDFVGNECSAGYFCTEGSQSPTQNYCTVNHYCPRGSGIPLLCPPGLYQSNIAQYKCEECPLGNYCLYGDIIPCSAGHYCP